MRILFSVEKPRDGQFRERNHSFFEAKEGIAFRNPSKVLTVLIGKAIKNKSSKFIHTLTILVLRISLQEGVDDASEAVKVVGFGFLLLL